MDRELMLHRHRALVRNGWVRRFTVEGPRLSEMLEFYESMGLEVLVEPGIPEEGQECNCCFEAEAFYQSCKTIYTRGELLSDTGDELFY